LVGNGGKRKDRIDLVDKLRVKIVVVKKYEHNFGRLSYEFLQINPKTGEKKWMRSTMGGGNINKIPSDVKNLLQPRYKDKIRNVVVYVPWGKKAGMTTVLRRLGGADVQ